MRQHRDALEAQPLHCRTKIIDDAHAINYQCSVECLEPAHGCDELRVVSNPGEDRVFAELLDPASLRAVDFERDACHASSIFPIACISGFAIVTPVMGKNCPILQLFRDPS